MPVSDIPPYLAANPAPAAEVQPEDDFLARERSAWRKSLLALLATQGADVATSIGGYESNKRLASDNGKFGAKGTAIKSGLTGGLALAEHLLGKKYPQLLKYFKYVNYGASIPTGITAGLNMRPSVR